MGIVTRKTKNHATAAKKERAPPDRLLTQSVQTTTARQGRADQKIQEITPVTPTKQTTASAKAESIQDYDKLLSAATYFAGGTKNEEGRVPVAAGIDFKKLGIKPAPVADRRKAIDKDSTLVLAIIPNVAICFRFKPNNPAIGSWAEKIMFDECRDSSDWIVNASISTWAYTWHIKNEKQVNPKMWGIRLFFLYVENTDIAPKALRSLGEHIVHHVNAHKKNTTVTVIPPDDEYFWVRSATWYDLVGMETSLEKLKEATTSTFYEGYYQQYKDIIHTYFKPGTFSIELACTLYAPMSCIDPALLRAAKKKQKSADKSLRLNPNVAHSPNFHMATDDDDTLVDLNNEASEGDEEEDDDEDNEFE